MLLLKVQVAYHSYIINIYITYLVVCNLFHSLEFLRGIELLNVDMLAVSVIVI